MRSRVDLLAIDAPDLVAAWHGVSEGAFVSVRHEVRRRAGEGSAELIVPQLAAVAVGGRWPVDAPAVVPGVPGVVGATREDLVRRLATSQRIIERGARTIAGHETEPCPLEHPLVGRMRCGEWLLFSGVHDLMHLEQLEAREASLA